MIQKYFNIRERIGGLAAGVVLTIVALPAPSWGQWSGTNPITTNSNVGIGTSNPQGGLHAATAPQWSGFNYGPSVIVDGVRNNVIAFLDYSHGNAWAIGSAAPMGDSGLQFSAMPALGNTTIGPMIVMSLSRSGNVGIGTMTPQYKLAVNGNIGAQDIIVTNTGWSDYVFRPGYRLRPLTEVSEYIEANGHLPEIPTEAEVKEKGVSVGEMQAKLLAKVEELTLHLIQQDKESRVLRESLTQENRELRERLAKLEQAASTQPASAAKK